MDPTLSCYMGSIIFQLHFILKPKGRDVMTSNSLKGNLFHNNKSMCHIELRTPSIHLHSLADSKRNNESTNENTTPVFIL